MKLLTKPPYVAILLRTSAQTYREVRHGILQYAHMESPWAVSVNSVSEKRDEQSRLDYQSENFSGVVIDETNDLMDRLESFGDVPIVTIKSVRPPMHLPKKHIYLYCDNRAIGEAAAKFLVGKGFKSFAYVNHVLNHEWSRERGSAFAAAIRRAGFKCTTYHSPSRGESNAIARDRPVLAKWLRELPKPVAMFVANDVRALDVLAACRGDGIAVPRDIAILSCDDDKLICETASTPLSSIRFSTTAAGYKAASIMDRFIRGEKNISRAERLVPYGPESVTERLSSEQMRSSDPLVEKALSLIRLNAFSNLHVQTIAQRLNVSRRTLEMRLRSATGRSVYDEILRTRFARACECLRDGKLTIAETAARCNFPDASHFGVMFKRHFGMTPSAYRARHRP